MVCKSLSKSSLDSKTISAQVFLTIFGSLVDPFLVGPGQFVLRRHSRPLSVLRLQVLGVPEWMTQV